MKKFISKIISFLIFVLDIPAEIIKIWLKLSKRSWIFVDKYNHKYLLDSNDSIGLNYRRRAISDSTNVTDYILKTASKGQTCIDIGAAYGSISIPMWSRVGKSGKVFSIEADPNKISRIMHNLSLNNFATDKVFLEVISDKIEDRYFRFYPDSPGWNTLGNPEFANNYKSYTTVVHCTNINAFIKKHNIIHIDLVKIDAEGAELKILSGMKTLLKRKLINSIIFESNPLMLPGMSTTPEKLLLFWNDLPYNLFTINKGGALGEISKNSIQNDVLDIIAIASTEKSIGTNSTK